MRFREACRRGCRFRRSAIRRSRASARYPRHGIPAAGVTCARRDPRRRHRDLHQYRHADRSTEIGPCRGERLRGKSTCRGHPLPSCGANRWWTIGLSLGRRAQARAARQGELEVEELVRPRVGPTPAPNTDRFVNLSPEGRTSATLSRVSRASRFGQNHLEADETLEIHIWHDAAPACRPAPSLCHPRTSCHDSFDLPHSSFAGIALRSHCGSRRFSRRDEARPTRFGSLRSFASRALDHDDLGSNRSKVVKRDRFHKCRAGCGR
jgi:hypothetical protein